MHARHGARRRDVELDRRVRVRRAHDDARGACRAARCRRRSGPRRRRAAGRSGAGRACPTTLSSRSSSQASRLLLDEHPALLEAALHLDLVFCSLAISAASASAARSTARSISGIGAAAAEVAAHRRAHLLARRPRRRRQQRGRRDDLARRAEAALERVLLDERPLQRRQRALVAEALDRRRRRALGLRGEQDAREHRAPVDEHGAGAAGALGAGDLRAREADLVAQHLGERRALGRARPPLAPVQLSVTSLIASTVSGLGRR